PGPLRPGAGGLRRARSARPRTRAPPRSAPSRCSPRAWSHRRSARPGGRSPGRWRRRRSVFGLVDAPNGADARLQILWMRLVDDLPLLLAGVHDLALARPDGDVVAVADEVARLGRAER